MSGRQQASGEVRGERHRAYHTNWHQDSVVFREAKRGGGWLQPAQRGALLVECCREPARHGVLVQQNQERYCHAQRCDLQVFARRFERQYVPEERRAPRRRNRLIHAHFGRRWARSRESRSAREKPIHVPPLFGLAGRAGNFSSGNGDLAASACSHTFSFLGQSFFSETRHARPCTGHSTASPRALFSWMDRCW